MPELITADPREVAPSQNPTVPVGVMPPGAATGTLATKVTGWP